MNEVAAFTHAFRVENGEWPSQMRYFRDGPLEPNEAGAVLGELVDQGLLETETKEITAQQAEVHKFIGL